MKLFLVTLLVLSTFMFTGFAMAKDPVAITGSLGSPTENCGTYAPTDPSSHTFMVGDSLTARGTDDILALRPHWEVNGKTGRNVDCLVQFIDERLKHGFVSRVVIALGTNAVEGWGQAEYQAVVDAIPTSATILFVNTYRNTTLWPATNPFRIRGSVQYYYSGYMANIAAGPRAGVCVANWRSWAANHPNNLTDGTHPDAAGQLQWASIIDTAASNCVSPKMSR